MNTCNTISKINGKDNKCISLIAQCSKCYYIGCNNSIENCKKGLRNKGRCSNCNSILSIGSIKTKSPYNNTFK